MVKQLFKYFIIFLLSIFFSLYCFEYYLVNNVGYLNLQKKSKIYKKQTGLDYDKRSKIQAYKDLKKNFTDLTVTIVPKSYAVNYPDIKIMPLSGVSNSKTLHCNENGYYSIFDSDRYGFNNPDKEWDKLEIEFLLLGDSLTMGECVNRPNDFTSNLRILSGKSALNLGYSSNGPNIQLAVLREFMGPNVKKILWMYFEGNDLKDLEDTKVSKILEKYILDKNFSQNLKLKQNEIDKINKLEIQNHLTYYESRNAKSLKYSILRFIRLDKTKNFLFKLIDPPIDPHTIISDETFYKFQNILRIAKNYANFQGAEFYLIYLPEYSSLINDASKNKFNKSKVLKILNRLDIKYIDLEKEINDQNINPKKLYPFGLPGHFNEKGYKDLSKIIFNKLKDE